LDSVLDSPEPGLPLLNRRTFLAGLGAFVTTQVLLPRTLRGSGLSNNLRPLRIGFLTDCHSMEEKGAPQALDRAAQLMNSLQPDLIIGGGDFVHGGFHNSGRIMDRRWKVADKFLKKLHTKVEPIIGNHDFYEPVLADGTPSPTDPRWKWKKYFGLDRTYRSFSFRGYRFLMLDSVKVVGGANPYRGWIEAAQLSWLDRELQRIPSNQPIILCTHIPFRTSLRDSFGPFVGPSPGRVRVLNADAVLSRLKDRPLALVLQGHVHINERLSDKAVPFVTGGAVCGKWWDGPNMGTWPGLGLIEIKPSGGLITSSDELVSWNYLNLPGAPVTSSIPQVA
jgi:3',5'-cyclic-AMP phosphodiesterase